MTVLEVDGSRTVSALVLMPPSEMRPSTGLSEKMFPMTVQLVSFKLPELLTKPRASASIDRKITKMDLEVNGCRRRAGPPNKGDRKGVGDMKD